MRKLVRRLGWLNVLVTFFGVLFLAALIVTAVFLYRAVTLIHTSEQKLTKTTQTLNLQNQACSDSSLKALLQRAGYCP